MKYRIYSKTGDDYGIYEGVTPEEAWEAMVKDAGGHTTDADGHDTAGTPEDWTIKRVDPYLAELQQAGELYMLTDGREVSRELAMTADEAADANRRARDATDGTWVWVRKQ